MGRIKTQLIKRVSLVLAKNENNKFTKDFNENKKIVTEKANITSKKLRNVIAGYVTRLTKAKE